MAERSKISLARFPHGVCIRVEGSGTMTESPVVHAFAERVLAAGGDQQVVIDLAACSYLDSTFLGGLVSLLKRHRDEPGERFAIFAPAPQRQALFGVSRLDRVLPFADQLPILADEALPLEPIGPSTRDELARYVVDCHRRLAELGGAEAQAFDRVADAIESELRSRGRS